MNYLTGRRSPAFRLVTALFALVTLALLCCAFVAEEQGPEFVGGMLDREEAGRWARGRAPVYAALALFALAAVLPPKRLHALFQLLGLAALVFAWQNLLGARLGKTLAFPSSVPFLVCAAAGAGLSLIGWSPTPVRVLPPAEVAAEPGAAYSNLSGPGGPG